MSDLPPLDPDLLRLLDVERARPPLAPGVRDRLLGRIEGSIATAATVGAAGVAVSATAAKKTWLLTLSAFFLGGVLGAAAMWFRPAPEPRTVTIEKRVEVAVPVTVVVSAPAASPPPVAPSTSLASPPTTATVGTAKGSSDAAERVLIEKIHSALGHGDPGGALSAVAEHEKQFPAGSHTDEREALAVQALSRQGRMDDARARADRFRKRFPGSFFRSIVDNAVGAKP